MRRLLPLPLLLAAGACTATATTTTSTTSVGAAVGTSTAAAAHGAADAVNAKIMKSGVFEVLRIVEQARQAGLARMIGGMVETRLAMGTSASIAAGLGGFAFVDLDTPLFMAEDPFDGGYVQRGERIDLTAIRLGHGCRPRDQSDREHTGNDGPRLVERRSS